VLTRTNISVIIISTGKQRTQKQEGTIVKVKIKIEGKINDTYTFQQPEEGNIIYELAAIIEEMKAGRIEKVEIEREA
jgi:hypothetical protein